MSLIELKNYMQQVKISDLLTMSVHFKTDPTVIRPMLHHWQRKGCVRQCPRLNRCGSQCMKCNPLMTEVYQWLASGTPQQPLS